MVDVKSRTCEYEDCDTQPVYNYKGEKTAIFCVEHKLEGMVDIKTKTCEQEDCITIPNYNYRGEKRAIFCVKHKLEGMINVKHMACKTYLCDTQATTKYEGYCFRCFCFLFPDKPIVRNYKTKEFEVFNFIKTTFIDQTWISNKSIQDGCSKKFPDALCDLGYQVIIVEVDENSHKSYDCICENKRTAQLSQDVGHRPLVIIRFNPDKYIDKDGKIIRSCWSESKETKKLKVDKRQEKNWKRGYAFLKI